MKNHGEFKSVRSTTNHPETTDQAQQIDVGGGQQNGTSTPEAAFGDTKSLAGSARTPPEAVNRLREIWDAADAALDAAYNAYDIADADVDAAASAADAAYAAYRVELIKQKEQAT